MLAKRPCSRSQLLLFHVVLNVVFTYCVCMCVCVAACMYVRLSCACSLGGGAIDGQASRGTNGTTAALYVSLSSLCVCPFVCALFYVFLVILVAQCCCIMYNSRCMNVPLFVCLSAAQLNCTRPVLLEIMYGVGVTITNITLRNRYFLFVVFVFSGFTFWS